MKLPGDQRTSSWLPAYHCGEGLWRKFILHPGCKMKNSHGNPQVKGEGSLVITGQSSTGQSLNLSTPPQHTILQRLLGRPSHGSHSLQKPTDRTSDPSCFFTPKVHRAHASYLQCLDHHMAQQHVLRESMRKASWKSDGVGVGGWGWGGADHPHCL